MDDEALMDENEPAEGELSLSVEKDVEDDELDE